MADSFWIVVVLRWKSADMWRIQCVGATVVPGVDRHLSQWKLAGQKLRHHRPPDFFASSSCRDSILSGLSSTLRLYFGTVLALSSDDVLSHLFPWLLVRRLTFRHDSRIAPKTIPSNISPQR